MNKSFVNFQSHVEDWAGVCPGLGGAAGMPIHHAFGRRISSVGASIVTPVFFSQTSRKSTPFYINISASLAAHQQSARIVVQSGVGGVFGMIEIIFRLDSRA